MSINPRIIGTIDEVCKESENLKKFLKEMLMIELNENTGHWTVLYKDKITKYVNYGRDK